MALLEDVLPRQPAVVRSVGHRKKDLRCQHVPVPPPAGEELAPHLLRFAFRVRVGRIEEVDPEIERAVHDGPRPLGIDRVAERQPAADSDFREFSYTYEI